MSVAVNQPRTHDVTLECEPTRIGTKLVFSYRITNHGNADIYVMDALAAVDASRRAVAHRDSAVVYLMRNGHAHVLKGIAALPTDRSVAVRIIPLAARLPAGAVLARELTIPLPLAETSPYFPDLPLRQYELVETQGLFFSVEFLRGTATGFSATPVDFAPDLYRVSAQNTVGMTERVTRTFPSQRLSIMKRPDEFPRPD
jgi:hypothetical protein